MHEHVTYWRFYNILQSALFDFADSSSCATSEWSSTSQYAENFVKEEIENCPGQLLSPSPTQHISFTSRSGLCVASLIIRYSVVRDNAIFFFLFIAYRPVFMTKDRASTFIFRQLAVYARKQCPPYTRPKSKAESFTIVPKKTP